MSERDREFGAIGSFLSRASRNELVDVLILPFVDEEIEVSLAEKTNARKIAVIEDHQTLLQYCSDLEKRLKFARTRKVASETLSQIFNISYGPEGVPGFRLGLFDWMGSSQAALPPLYVIRRNRIQDDTLCRFLRTFRSVPPMRRPKVVVDSERNVQEARSLLRLSKDNISAFVPARAGIQRSTIDVAEGNIDRFPEAILAGGVSACANTRLGRPSWDAPLAERRRYAVFLYQRIQANKACDHRFEAATDVDRLEQFLREELAGGLDEHDRRWFAEALVFTLLDRSYVLEEGPQPIENALAIAQQLDDEDLAAWVLRHVNISAGVSPFASDQLDQAALKLQEAGRFVQAAYAATNRTITDLHRLDAPIDVGRAEAVVDYVLDWAPYCERLSSIINAAGAAALIAGNLYRAEELFRRALDANGGRLHRISAQINLRITQYVGGARHTVDDIESIYRAIQASKMSRKLDYHHVYLLANLIGLTRSKSLKGRIRAHLREAAYMDYDQDTVANDRLLMFLATKFTMIADGQRFRGRRGQFVEEYGLLPLAQFIWN